MCEKYYTLSREQRRLPSPGRVKGFRGSLQSRGSLFSMPLAYLSVKNLILIRSGRFTKSHMRKNTPRESSRGVPSFCFYGFHSCSLRLRTIIMTATARPAAHAAAIQASGVLSPVLGFLVKVLMKSAQAIMPASVMVPTSPLA